MVNEWIFRFHFHYINNGTYLPMAHYTDNFPLQFEIGLKFHFAIGQFLTNPLLEFGWQQN